MIKLIAIAPMLLATSMCSIASACPLCRDSAAISSRGGANPPGGLFNASVLCILGAFLVVAGLLVAKIIGAVRVLNRSATGG
jgi:hypothetical protein